MTWIWLFSFQSVECFSLELPLGSLALNQTQEPVKHMQLYYKSVSSFLESKNAKILRYLPWKYSLTVVLRVAVNNILPFRYYKLKNDDSWNSCCCMHIGCSDLFYIYKDIFFFKENIRQRIICIKQPQKTIQWII